MAVKCPHWPGHTRGSPVNTHVREGTNCTTVRLASTQNKFPHLCVGLVVELHQNDQQFLHGVTHGAKMIIIIDLLEL